MWFTRKPRPGSSVSGAHLSIDQKIDKVLTEVGEGLIRIDWRVVCASRAGERLSLSPGASEEFVGAREFEPDDDPRQILASATARTGGRPVYVKVCQPPMVAELELFADVNRTLNFGHSRENKLWLAARCAATTILSANQTQDLLGFAAYANMTVVRRIPQTHPDNLVRPVVGAILEPPYSKGNLDCGLGVALKTLAGPNKKEVIIISDFLNFTPEQRELLKMAAVTHSIKAVVVQDKRERYLPEVYGPLKVFDLTSGKQKTWWLKRKTRKQYTQEFEEHEARLLSYFAENGIRYAVVNTDEGHESTTNVLRLLLTPTAGY